jgi:DNA-binding transcriptional LysR family regulator
MAEEWAEPSVFSKAANDELPGDYFGCLKHRDADALEKYELWIDQFGSQMEMRHLRALIAVAEEMHFGRAAERLHLSQPPVSLAIKELETELGVRLFDRTSRRMELTRAGEEVLRDARAVLARIEGMRQHARSAASGHAGSLSIGFISTAAYTFLPKVLRNFTQDFPKTELTLLESTTDQIVADLEKGTLDLGCAFSSSQLPACLTYRTTSREPLVAVLPANHALAKLPKVPVERLANERFLVFERHIGPMMFDNVVSVCMRHGFSPKIFPTRAMNTVVSLVAGGMGVALVPMSIKVMHREGVVYLPLRGEPTLIESGVMWRTEDDSPALASLLAYLPRNRQIPEEPLATNAATASGQVKEKNLRLPRIVQ